MVLRHFTFIRRCLYIIVLSIFLFFVSNYVYAIGEEFNENELYAQSAVLMDGKTKRVLVEKNGYEPMPMASTTKIMTCIIALENADLETVVTVSEYAASMPKVHLGMIENEQYILKDLLYSLMLESHNDTAVAVAEGVAGNMDNFLKLMNDKAKEIGCEDTLFLTTNGLDKSVTDDNGVIQKHHTTAVDLARIMSYCINESSKRNEFLEITGAKSYSFSNVDKTRNFTCTNHNLFLGMMDGALSGKTGFTNAAGYCYVGALRDNDRDYIVSLLACGWPNNKSYKWSDTRKLMSYGIDEYTNKQLAVNTEEFNIKVEDGVYNVENELGSNVKASASGDLPEFLISNEENIELVYEIEQSVSAPVSKGQKLGTLKYFINDYQVYEESIVTNETVEKQSFIWAFNELIKIIFQ